MLDEDLSMCGCRVLHAQCSFSVECNSFSTGLAGGRHFTENMPLFTPIATFEALI